MSKTAAGDQTLLEGVPQPGPVPPLRIGRVSQTTLSNGVAVMVVPRPSVPRLEFRLSVPAGTALGPSAALSELLAMGIPLGTESMDQAELAERIQDLGGSLQVHQDEDRLFLHAAALSAAEEDLYRLLAEVVEEPAFPAAALATEKAKLLEGLRMARATAQFPAAETLQGLIYGSHPYGRRAPSDSAVRGARRRALLDLHRLTFTPRGAQITVVGAVEPRRT
ncbi:MAG: hypothetical protein M0T72_11275, partial [Candidatus Dormibacteraeota bacterium]|nr:hypothetical protein [Candidatus Dormibacteraeota bacterium]